MCSLASGAFVFMLVSFKQISANSPWKVSSMLMKQHFASIGCWKGSAVQDGDYVRLVGGQTSWEGKAQTALQVKLERNSAAGTSCLSWSMSWSMLLPVHASCPASSCSPGRGSPRPSSPPTPRTCGSCDEAFHRPPARSSPPNTFCNWCNLNFTQCYGINPFTSLWDGASYTL